MYKYNCYLVSIYPQPVGCSSELIHKKNMTIGYYLELSNAESNH